MTQQACVVNITILPQGLVLAISIVCSICILPWLQATYHASLKFYPRAKLTVKRL